MFPIDPPRRVISLTMIVSMLLGALMAPAFAFDPSEGMAVTRKTTFPFSIREETLEVTVESFFIRSQRVNYREFGLFLAENPEASTPEYWDFYSRDPDRSVVGVNIQDILPFNRWLSDKDPEHTYRLPTEAELVVAESQGLLLREEEVSGDFTLDYFSDSFESWMVEELPILNPFGPVFPQHGPQLAPNLVGIVWSQGKNRIRGPLAPDYTGTRFGFRYAYSPEGPGPLGARIMLQTAASEAEEIPSEATASTETSQTDVPESEVVDRGADEAPILEPVSTATPDPTSTPSVVPPTPTASATHSPLPTPTATSTSTGTPTPVPDPTNAEPIPPSPSVVSEATSTLLTPGEEDGEFEVAPVFSPDQILPEELVSGPGYRVTDQVTTEGMFYSFALWTQFGWYHPQSLSMLRIRISEVVALNALAEIEKQTLFLEGLTARPGQAGPLIENSSPDPIEKESDLPLGLQKFVTGSGDTNPGFREGLHLLESSPTLDLHSKRGRQLSIRFGVDPYSENQTLRDAIAAISSNKNYTLLMDPAASSFDPGGVGLALSAAQVSKAIQDRLVELSASEIRRQNVTDLLDLDCDPAWITSFMDHPSYSPTSQSIIVTSMLGLAEVENLPQILSTILNAPAREIAHFHQTQLQMAHAYHLKVDRLESLSLEETTPVFFNSEKKMVIFLPVDYLYWNERIAQGLKNLQQAFGGEGGQLWITGRATDRANEELLARGIDVYDRALYKLWGN